MKIMINRRQFFVTFTVCFLFIDASFHLKICLATFLYELGKHIHKQTPYDPNYMPQLADFLYIFLERKQKENWNSNHDDNTSKIQEVLTNRSTIIICKYNLFKQNFYEN